MKIRPIIGGPASPTSHLSELIDILLKPFMFNLPSFVKDSRDLLIQANEWESNPEEDYVLVTMDISAMYMNISKSLGLKAITHFITEHPELLHPRFTLNFILEAIEIVLDNNVSYFDGHYRRQTHGCAMGSHDSPPYASLAVGYVEKETYERLNSMHGETMANYVRKMLRRFLDDVFMKWKMSLGQTSILYDVINNIDPKIKFTMENGKSVPFLDVAFTVETDGSLSTDIYYKETDSHNYVPFNSFHPKKTLTNVPYTLARRICTIVSKPGRRDERLEEMRGDLKKKFYPDGVISCGINRALAISRDDLLRQSNRATTETRDIPFVFTNNSCNPNVIDSIRNGADVLLPSDRMRKVMSDRRIIAARRQPQNIRSMLFRPRFDTNQSSVKGSVKPCKSDPNRKIGPGQPCRCCDLIDECSSIRFHNSTENFEIRHHFTCDSSNLLYALTCGNCGLNYIGQTERTVRDRCGDYRRAINTQKFTQGVHEHLHRCGKGVFSITPFFKIKGQSKDHSTILAYEDFFIKKFKPQLNASKLGP